MKIIIGFIVVSIGFIAASVHLNQGLLSYWDFVAFAVVLCGIIAVSIITSPSLKFGIIWQEIIDAFKNNNGRREDAIHNSVNVMRGNIPTGSPKRIDQKILVDGIELLQLGFSTEKIESILSDRINNYSKDCMSIANWVRGLAKYPPAFGLAGTVLGLIHLMRGIAEGTNPQETGIRMAIALVATLYGIIVANILLNPMGERIKANIQENEILSEISLKTILMIKERVNLVEAQEHLTSYLTSSNKKINVLKKYLEAA